MEAGAGQSTDWRDFQRRVANYFRGRGCEATVDATVQGVRAAHKVDVLVTFYRAGMKCKWIIECKLWNRRVPKEKVQALRSIVDDVGADRGILISENGFQSGAYDASRGTNVTLIPSWQEVESTIQLDSSSLELTRGTVSDRTLALTFSSDQKPYGLLLWKDIVYVGNWESGNIALFDPRTRMVLDVINLDKYEAGTSGQGSRGRIWQYPPGAMIVADDKLFVGQVFSDFVLVIDIETRAVVRRIVIPGGGEGELARSADGQYIYFSSNKVPAFFVIDSATYTMEAISYPGNGRGCMSVLAHPFRPVLYIGIQRGGELNGVSYPGGNSFLAVYDLAKRRYAATHYLAEIIDGRSDDSTPCSMTHDPEGDLLYIGMFQSRKGIYVLDCKRNEMMDNISFTPNTTNLHFPWVDPLSLALWNDYLVSVNRNNHELVLVEKGSTQVSATVPLSVAANGPKEVVVWGREAIVSYPGFHSLILVDLERTASGLRKN